MWILVAFSRRFKGLRVFLSISGENDPMNTFYWEPLAYFLTWGTYGTRLPGDERGWAEHGQGWQPPSPVTHFDSRARMVESPKVLTRAERDLVNRQIKETCSVRGWKLFEVDCRTNHVHVVVHASDTPATKVRDDLKAWCTRRLRELEPTRKHWWGERGSQRYINDEASLAKAIEYVRKGQDHASRWPDRKN